MNGLALTRTHIRITRRSWSLWLAVLPLTALATLVAVASPAAPRSGGVGELVFTGQIIAILAGIGYAAAFADFTTTPMRLGMDELEAGAPTRPIVLRGARILGAFSVVIVPTLGVLLVLGGIQAVSGRPAALAASIAVAATVDGPAALLAIALSALAGAVLPRGLGRIVAVLAWFWLVFSSPLIPAPTLNGTILSVVGDPVAAGYFGSAPIYQPRGVLTAPSAWSATASLVWQGLLVIALLAAAHLARARRR